MSKIFSSTSTMAIVAFLAVAPIPAQAQSTATKEGWLYLRAFLSGTGLEVSVQSTSFAGDTMILHDLQVREDGSDEVTLMIPEMRVQARGAQLALIPSPEFHVLVRPNRNQVHDFRVTHDGEFVTQITDTSLALQAMFGQLSVVLVEAANTGTPANLGFDLALDGFNGHFTANMAGDVDLGLSAASARYSLQINDMAALSPMRQDSSAQIDALELTFSAAQLATLERGDHGVLRRAFDAGLFAHLSFTSGASSSTTDQVLDGTPFTMQAATASSAITADLADGRFDVSTQTTGGDFVGGMGPVNGTVTLGGLSMSLGGPVLSTPQNVPMHLTFALDQLTVSPELLALANAQDFAGDAVSLTADLGVDGRLLTDVGPDLEDADEPPFDIGQVQLNNLIVSVGSTQLTGSGAVALLGTLAQQMRRDRPDLNGDLVFELVGGNALLTRLSAAGLIPADQQFLVQMMMNGLGRSVGEDHLRSEVTMRAGGQVLVNGAPLPF